MRLTWTEKSKPAKRRRINLSWDLVISLTDVINNEDDEEDEHDIQYEQEMLRKREKRLKASHAGAPILCFAHLN